MNLLNFVSSSTTSPGNMTFAVSQGVGVNYDDLLTVGLTVYIVMQIGLIISVTLLGIYS
jgi:hypothetical protein